MIDYYDIESIKSETFGNDLSKCHTKIVHIDNQYIGSYDQNDLHLGWEFTYSAQNYDLITACFHYPPDYTKLMIFYSDIYNMSRLYDTVILKISDKD